MPLKEVHQQQYSNEVAVSIWSHMEDKANPHY